MSHDIRAGLTLLRFTLVVVVPILCSVARPVLCDPFPSSRVDLIPTQPNPVHSRIAILHRPDLLRRACYHACHAVSSPLSASPLFHVLSSHLHRSDDSDTTIPVQYVIASLLSLFCSSPHARTMSTPPSMNMDETFVVRSFSSMNPLVDLLPLPHPYMPPRYHPGVVHVQLLPMFGWHGTSMTCACPVIA